MKRSRALTSACVILTAVVGFPILAWNAFAEPYAKRKAEEFFKVRFDDILIDDFELEWGEIHVGRLRASKDDLVFDGGLVVRYGLGWSLDPVISDVFVEGKVSGSPDSLLHDGGPTVGLGTGSRSTLLAYASLTGEVSFDFQGGDLPSGRRASGLLRFDRVPALGSWQFEVSDFQIYNPAVSAGNLRVDIDPDVTFPLEVSFADLSTSIRGTDIGGLSGAVKIADKNPDSFWYDLEWSNLNASGLYDLQTKNIYTSFSATNLDLGGISYRNNHILSSNITSEMRIITRDDGDGRYYRIIGDISESFLYAYGEDISNLSIEMIFSGRFEISLFPSGDIRLEPETRLIIGSVSEGGGTVIRPSLRYSPGDEIVLSIAVPRQDCMKVFRSAPMGMLPHKFSEFELSGQAGGDISIVLDLEDPEESEFHSSLDLDDCQVLNTPHPLSKMDDEVFSHSVLGRNGKKYHTVVGKNSRCDLSLDSIPAAIYAALLVTEDGTFFSHGGVRARQIDASFKRNVTDGRMARGGSTLTMQMVKNAFLSHEKTLGRKISELFLTWVVERKYSKEKILEIYLGIVEYGPGIYGVCNAAEHYFGKYIWQINSREAAFLATLMPRPAQRHESWCRNNISDGYMSYIDRVHRRMLDAGYISMYEYEKSASIPLEFSRNEFTNLKDCIESGREMIHGVYIQKTNDGFYE